MADTVLPHRAKRSVNRINFVMVSYGTIEWKIYSIMNNLSNHWHGLKKAQAWMCLFCNVLEQFSL